MILSKMSRLHGSENSSEGEFSGPIRPSSPQQGGRLRNFGAGNSFSEKPSENLKNRVTKKRRQIAHSALKMARLHEKSDRREKFSGLIRPFSPRQGVRLRNRDAGNSFFQKPSRQNGKGTAIPVSFQKCRGSTEVRTPRKGNFRVSFVLPQHGRVGGCKISARGTVFRRKRQRI